jgi:CRP/FNR family cyclic AMP-dependent transcriptional regulator
VSPNSDTALHQFLQQVFACPADVAASIGRRARDRRYAIKAAILSQGDSTETTFLMMTGRAHALTYVADGQMVLLHEFAPGDFFGAVTEARPAPEEADIVAVEDVRAVQFGVLDFLALIETYACVGLAVSRALLRQLRVAATRMAERTTLSAAGRVHAELLRLAKDGHRVEPVPVLSVLAVRVHSTRETVSRTISALERRGIVRREADALVIVAPHRLRDMIV